jgi:hypothetical protein
MSSHHTNPRALLNAATRHLIERVQRAGRPPMAAMTPSPAREFYDIGGPMLDLQPAPQVDRVLDFTIPASDGHAMPARLYAPFSDAALPVLLYIHGGGFTVGSLTTHDVLCRQLSRQGHCAVVSLDYRLAPEHRFPTAVHDSWGALNVVFDDAQLTVVFFAVRATVGEIQLLQGGQVVAQEPFALAAGTSWRSAFDGLATPNFISEVRVVGRPASQDALWLDSATRGTIESWVDPDQNPVNHLLLSYYPGRR